MKYEKLLDTAYEAYKYDWCVRRGVTPDDVDEDVGINGGECYVCRAEFESCEFQDKEYMESLLTLDEFAVWQYYVEGPSAGLSEAQRLGLVSAPGEHFSCAIPIKYTYKELVGMLESLVNSSSTADRHAAARLGYGLERLVYDEAFQVRGECARQGYGVSILVRDPEPSVRADLAKYGYALETLMHDENAYVRSAVVAQRYKLGVLIQDENSLVRWNVARQEYGWDVLVNDRANTVSREVKSMLKEKGLTLEDWIRLNPDKCHLPENRVRGLDAVIAEADSIREKRSKPTDRETGREDKERD